MKTVTGQHVSRIVDVYQEGILDCFGCLETILPAYITENFNVTLDSILEYEDFLYAEYGDVGSSDVINWAGYAKIFNSNKQINLCFWEHWNSIFLCTTCGKGYDGQEELEICSAPGCINSMCEDCLTVAMVSEPELDFENTQGGLRFIPGSEVQRERPFCKKCRPDAYRPEKCKEQS